MLRAEFRRWTIAASHAIRRPIPLSKYSRPIATIFLGTSSLLLFPSLTLCDSPRTSTTTTTSSASSRAHTTEDHLDAESQRKDRSLTTAQSEQTALTRLKSSFSDLSSKLTDFDPPTLKLPDTFRLPPHFLEWVEKIRAEVSFAPGSVADEIWQESLDGVRNPEIEVDARVWMGNEFSEEEMAFSRQRRKFTRRGLAKYLGVDEAEIDERDVPTIAIAGSGGGYRAMLGTTGYLKAMKKDGLFDCVTYLAGVSGSCWAINTYFTYGERSIEKMIEHFKARLSTSFTDPAAALPLFMERPTNKYLLRGLVERFKQGYTELGMVDIFGTLVSSRILVPANELAVQDDLLKLSNQRKFIDDGSEPLPIYTAVRHEIPVKAVTKGKTKKEEVKEAAEGINDLASTGEGGTKGSEHLELQQRAREESWFQWYYVGCEELEAWIPTFGLGRQYNNGVNVTRTPELRLSIIIGIVGSAFCATLSHYYAEIRPFLPTSYAIFRSLDELMKEKDKDLIAVHPIQPASIPNFLLGMHDSLPSTCPESIKSDPEIKLMDGGMSNNIPFYPLLRREVDIVIALDTSADIQTTPWFERTDGYAKQKGIIGWPVGAGWPKESSPPAQSVKDITTTQPTTPTDATQKLDSAKQHPHPDSPTDPITVKYGLGHCNIWIGTTVTRTSADEPPPPKQLPLQLEEEAEGWRLDPSDGIMLVYLPLLPNAAVPGVVPEETEWMSTWNFEYSGEQVEKVVELGERNFEVGGERIRRAVRAVWERKREQRMQREREGRIVEMGRVLSGSAVADGGGGLGGGV